MLNLKLLKDGRLITNGLKSNKDIKNDIRRRNIRHISSPIGIVSEAKNFKKLMAEKRRGLPLR